MSPFRFTSWMDGVMRLAAIFLSWDGTSKLANIFINGGAPLSYNIVRSIGEYLKGVLDSVFGIGRS